jgi:hypothetical protein
MKRASAERLGAWWLVISSDRELRSQARVTAYSGAERPLHDVPEQVEVDTVIAMHNAVSRIDDLPKNGNVLGQRRLGTFCPTQRSCSSRQALKASCSRLAVSIFMDDLAGAIDGIVNVRVAKLLFRDQVDLVPKQGFQRVGEPQKRFVTPGS